MATTKLLQFQEALRLLGDARLATLTDDYEARYALDDAWAGSVNFCLRQAAWRFALVTSLLVPAVGSAPGYANLYGYPADWLRTHAIYLSLTDGRERPLDLREQLNLILTNSTPTPTMRHVSNVYADPSFLDHPWPDHFAHLQAAHLAFMVAERVTGERAAAARMSQLFSSLLPEAIAIDAVPENDWLRFQRSGAYLSGLHQLLAEGDWRFAIKTADVVAGGTPATGYSNSFVKPADWLRDNALYVSVAGREFPFDVKDQDTHWSANVSAFTTRYVSFTLGINSVLWPEPFAKALLAFLMAEESGQMARDGEGKPDAKGKSDFPALVSAALRSHGLLPSPWLYYQLDGTFERARRAVIDRGNWTFPGAMRALDIDTSMQSTLSPDAGFPYRFALPDDHVRTISLYLAWDGGEYPFNIRQDAQGWSTDAGAFVAKYVSTAALDATNWPEPVAQAVLSYCDWQAGDDEKGEQPAEQQVDGADFEKRLATALALHSIPEDAWLRFQLDGRYIHAVKALGETGRWRFAVKTAVIEDSTDPNAFSDGSISTDYSTRLLKPLDWMRTLRLYFSYGSGQGAVWRDIDYRDELGALHANYAPATIRYVSRLLFDSTQWPAHFRSAVLAWLEYEEARSNPNMAGVARQKLDFFTEQEQAAERLDDERDTPRIIRPGRFVQGRYGRSTRDLKQGLPPYGW